MKKSNNKKGFTLVELVIVVAVIAILSAILIPTIGTVIKDAKDAAVKSDLRTVITNEMVQRDEVTGEIKDNKEIPEQYFVYSENATLHTDKATVNDFGKITYVLHWTGNEVEIVDISTIAWAVADSYAKSTSNDIDTYTKYGTDGTVAPTILTINDGKATFAGDKKVTYYFKKNNSYEGKDYTWQLFGSNFYSLQVIKGTQNNGSSN